MVYFGKSCQTFLSILLLIVGIDKLSGYRQTMYFNTVSKIYGTVMKSMTCIRRSSLSTKLSTTSEQTEYLFGNEPSLFSEIPSIHPMITKALSIISREKATLIQLKVLPTLLQNTDVVISSETGSGKTLAYLIPLFQTLLENAIQMEKVNETSDINQETADQLEPHVTSSYPHAVILVPNKDLAAQVVNMGKEFSDAILNVSGIQINVNSLTRNVGNERWPYKNGNCPSILVCTPTIISNFVRGPIVTDESLFRSIKQLVLDEADMLVEGSYLIEMEKIMEALKKARREMIRNKLIPVRSLYTMKLIIYYCYYCKLF